MAWLQGRAAHPRAREVADGHKEAGTACKLRGYTRMLAPRHILACQNVVADTLSRRQAEHGSNTLKVYFAMMTRQTKHSNSRCVVTDRLATQRSYQQQSTANLTTGSSTYSVDSPCGCVQHSGVLAVRDPRCTVVHLCNSGKLSVHLLGRHCSD